MLALSNHTTLSGAPSCTANDGKLKSYPLKCDFYDSGSRSGSGLANQSHHIGTQAHRGRGDPASTTAPQAPSHFSGELIPRVADEESRWE